MFQYEKSTTYPSPQYPEAREAVDNIFTLFEKKACEGRTLFISNSSAVVPYQQL